MAYLRSMIDPACRTCKLPHNSRLQYHKPMFTSYIIRLPLGLLFLFWLNFVHAATDRIVVSIKPLHSLISHITEGVNQTELLLDQQQSPHHFQLRPSQQRMLSNASIFIYSSDSLEGFAQKLKATSKNILFVELSSIDTIKPLPARDFGDDHHDHAHSIDGHLWLSIDNARKIAGHIAQLLSQRSPEHSNIYSQNLASLTQRLNNLQQQNRQILAEHSEDNFLVYHDALQYFEVENQLSGAHFITTSPEHRPGIRRIKQLKQLISEKQIRCIFYEPPVIPPLIKTLSKDTAAKLASIDPAGSSLVTGKQQYFELMTQIARTLHQCLGDSK